jgi:hypothetical protein
MPWVFNPFTGKLDQTAASGGGGNPFDQSLNTTDSTQFNLLTLSGGANTCGGAITIGSYGSNGTFNGVYPYIECYDSTDAESAGVHLYSPSGGWLFQISNDSFAGVGAFAIYGLNDQGHVFAIDQGGNIRLGQNATVDPDGNIASSGTISGSNLGTAAAKAVPISGNASSSQVVLGSDTRLTDSRTPTAHTHAAADITSGTIDNARLPTSFTSTNLTAPNQTAFSGSSILTRDLGDARFSPIIIAKKSTADIASTNTTLADVTGLTGFTLEANTMYRFEFTGRHTAASGGSHYLVLSSTAAIANASAMGWYIIFGSRTDAGFSNPSGNLYAFINRSSTGNTNNPSAAQYYILTGSTAPTMKIQFSQTGTAVGTSTLLAGSVACFTKLV